MPFFSLISFFISNAALLHSAWPSSTEMSGISAWLSSAAFLGLAKVKAIAEGRRPQGMAADEELVYSFISELYKTHQVSDARFAEVKKAFGERGMVDLVITAGYYQIVSMEMNVDRMPLGNGAAPPLKPIAKPLP